MYAHEDCPYSKPITKEVIESFGFKQGLTWVNEHQRYDKGEYCIQITEIDTNILTIYKYMGPTLFYGTINNPEELRFILTSLGIIE